MMTLWSGRKLSNTQHFFLLGTLIVSVPIIVKTIYYPLFLVFILAGVLFLGRVFVIKTGLIHITQKSWRWIEDCFHVYQFFKVPEFNESMQENGLYRKVSNYLNSLASLEDSNFTNLLTGKRSNDIVLRLDPNQVIDDDFLGGRVSWIKEERDDKSHSRSLVLKIRKADKRRILRPYLQHIHNVSDELEQRKNKELKFYVNINDADNLGHRNGRWRSVPFTHPSTFDTIAIESDLKNKVKSDLESFLKARQYYHRLGRVWKRSYLLYGPSGTGKSSFVSAMANFLGYDLYDVDLSRVADDSELKLLLLQTTSRSLIVIEDLDLFMTQKSTAVSLSGVLNFMDGISNSCVAQERIMVFTMNSKERLDPALLRPGRIDVHIRFPLCDFSAFKTLANSCLGVKDHKLFPQVEEIFQSGAKLSTAEIGELMIANRNSPSRALKSVIPALKCEGHRKSSASVGPAWRNSTSEVSDHSGVFSPGRLKEIKTLYGFLRLKGNKTSQPPNLSSVQVLDGHRGS